VVYLRIVNAATGEELESTKVTLFKDESTGRDFATQFEGKSARGIPFGVYRLRAHAIGYTTAERDVPVFEREVWVTLGLQFGMEGLSTLFRLSGKISFPPSMRNQLWVRLTSVYSSFVMDAKVDATGSFSMTSLPQGKHVLIVSNRSRILYLAQIDLPAREPLRIDLR